jgi:glycosyltransferase involved in cell wall biosynthesis
LSRKVPATRVIVGTFIHTYRWGRQIRGDERGYVEKVKIYRSLGVEFFTLERAPSIQSGMGEDQYSSMLLGNCPVPPATIFQLVMLSLFSLRAALRRYPSRPIAIYAYNQDVENIWVGYLLKVLLGAPLVIVFHQIRPASFTSLGQGIVDRTRRGFHPARAFFSSILPALNRFSAHRADINIALSEPTREDVERHVGIKDCAVVGNGLDTSKFRPIGMPKTYDAAFLGRLARQKGIDVLLNAWTEVVREKPDSQLVLVGGGEPKDESLYRKMAKDLQLERNVTFAGFVNDQDLVRLLNSSKLFVFPSRKEGFAQAVSQAMGCGMCCILSNISSLKEVYGNSAVFFPVDQPAALAKEIMKLLESDDERTLFAKRARARAQEFSWEGTVEQELALIFKRPASK